MAGGSIGHYEARALPSNSAAALDVTCAACQDVPKALHLRDGFLSQHTLRVLDSFRLDPNAP